MADNVFDKLDEQSLKIDKLTEQVANITDTLQKSNNQREVNIRVKLKQPMPPFASAKQFQTKTPHKAIPSSKKQAAKHTTQPAQPHQTYQAHYKKQRLHLQKAKAPKKTMYPDKICSFHNVPRQFC